MREERSTVLGTIVALLISFGVMFFKAFVGKQLFNWFLTPIFNFTFTYWHAFGICLVIDFATLGLQMSHSNENVGDITNIARPIVEFIVLAMILGVAALVSMGI
jgi:hypothetical protein